MTVSVISRPRFSGHETFACRFTWLPKAVRLIGHDPAALSDDDTSMLELGLGKNMVRSLRFWLEAFGVARSGPDGWSLFPFGETVLGPDGRDQFIERSETQWLLHWRLATAVEHPLFAWRHVFHRRIRPDFTRSELLVEMQQEGARDGYDHSEVTLLQHIDALLHSYVGGGPASSPEDALDGPMVDLRLIRTEGRRRGIGARSETVYALSRTSIDVIGGAVVDYAIEDFWARRRKGESIVTFRDLAYAEGSPGATLRLADDDLRDHLERPGTPWTFRATGDAGAVLMARAPDPEARLLDVFA